MKTLKLHQIATLASSLIFCVSAWAAPTSGTPYNTDPQNEYVQDSTTDAINNVNMILCIMDGMNMSGSGMINQGAYVALVDMNKCKSQGGSSDSSSSSSGASSSVNYMTAIVDVTRASTADPMVANVWMSMTEEGRSQDIYVKVRATSSPAEVPPYGVFRLDFMGKDSNNATQMNGYIDSASGLLQYFENGNNSSNIALALTATNTTSGSGTMTVAQPAPATFNFNFNTNYFRRDDGTNDRCFDRLKANAGRSVWRYGTYKDSDGSRVDQANPSFQLTATYSGNSHYGYASYWGVGFQGLDLNTINDANPVIGLVVHDQRPVHTSDTFSLSKVSGKLTKWTRNAKTLADMDGIPFNFGADLAGKTTGGSPAPSGWGNWQAHWDNTNSQFVVTGSQTCSPGTGCSLTSLTTPAVVTPNALNNMPISGWSDSFGGNINIPSKATNYAGGDPVYYFTQSLVIPGTSVPTLYCLSNCPDANSVNTANACTTNTCTTGAAPSPFNSSTVNQWFSAPAANTVAYAYGSGGLTDVATSTPMIITKAAFYAANTSFQFGVQTGRLFTAISNANCPGGTAVGTVCEPPDPAEYYTWSTSRDQWNQTMWLTHTNGTSNGNVVTFDPPQNIQYTVPNDATTYGTWANKSVQLQFNGFGNLGGIPGYCVNPVDNTVANCNQNTRYVPAFSIPDGATMTLGATTLVVKALDAEIRLKDIGVGATVCSSLPLSGSLTLPTSAGNHDVTAALGTYSIGTTRPTISNASPKVIDGVVQY